MSGHYSAFAPGLLGKGSIDRTGKTYGTLTLTRRTWRSYYEASCSACNEVVRVLGTELVRCEKAGKVKSCPNCGARKEA